MVGGEKDRMVVIYYFVHRTQITTKQAMRRIEA